jgi:hypothetical protein
MRSCAPLRQCRVTTIGAASTVRPLIASRRLRYDARHGQNDRLMAEGASDPSARLSRHCGTRSLGAGRGYVRACELGVGLAQKRFAGLKVRSAST